MSIVEEQNQPITPAEYKSKDTMLYQQWKQSGDKKALSQLVRQLNPLIYKEVQRVSGTLPTSALSAEAKKWAIHAIKTYDPDKGVSLSTHVVNYLPKVRRLNYKYQNMVRLPENQHLQFGEYKMAVDHLTALHDREPTDEELSKHLGWKKSEVTRFKGRLFDDLSEAKQLRPSQAHMFDNDKILFEHMLTQLSSDERFILENVEKYSNTEMADKLGVNLNRLNYLKSKLKDKLIGLKKEVGLV